MKQLYLIGILLAVVLLTLTGLSKLDLGARDATSEEATTTATTPESPPTPPTETPEEAQAPTATTTTLTTQTMETNDTTNITLKTSAGDITIELYTKDMPVTAGNFLKLAQSDFYDGVRFHRVIDGFMIQGGDPLTKDDTMAGRWGTGGPGYTIPDEFGPRYSNEIGTISMANAGPNTGGSQFFINTANNTFLDGKHPVFGRVVAGMDVVQAISKTATGPRDVPVTPITIADIVVAQ